MFFGCQLYIFGKGQCKNVQQDPRRTAAQLAGSLRSYELIAERMPYDEDPMISKTTGFEFMLCVSQFEVVEVYVLHIFLRIIFQKIYVFMYAIKKAILFVLIFLDMLCIDLSDLGFPTHPELSFTLIFLSLSMRKPTFWISKQFRPKNGMYNLRSRLEA